MLSILQSAPCHNPKTLPAYAQRHCFHKCKNKWGETNIFDTVNGPVKKPVLSFIIKYLIFPCHLCSYVYPGEAITQTHSAWVQRHSLLKSWQTSNTVLSSKDAQFLWAYKYQSLEKQLSKLCLQDRKLKFWSCTKLSRWGEACPEWFSGDQQQTVSRHCFGHKTDMASPNHFGAYSRGQRKDDRAESSPDCLSRERRDLLSRTAVLILSPLWFLSNRLLTSKYSP